MKAGVALIGLVACAFATPLWATTVKAPPLGCAAFMKDLPSAATGYRASFERPLTISRGFGDILPGIDIYVLATNAELDGTLKCHGDEFLRFELRIKAPPKDKAVTDFDAFQTAALTSAFHWDRGKAETVQKAMATDAADYLRASEQRGDVYLAGKVEYHQGDTLDLGVIWTPTDHSFVIASQSDG